MTLRWRLALLTAGITFLVLCAFALFIGQLTASRIRSDFRNEMAQAMNNLLSQGTLPITYKNNVATIPESVVRTYAAPNQAVIRVLSPDGYTYATTDKAPDFAHMGRPPESSGQVGDYRVLTRRAALDINGAPSVRLVAFVQYARKTGPTEA